MLKGIAHLVGRSSKCETWSYHKTRILLLGVYPRKLKLSIWTNLVMNVPCCLVARLFLTLFDPMDGSKPGFPVLHHFPEFAQTHVHWVSDAIQPSHHPQSSPPSSCLQSFPASGSFPVSQLFASGGQSINTTASVLPMNIKGYFPLGLTGLISLQSKGLSRVFSSTSVLRHQFFCA